MGFGGGGSTPPAAQPQTPVPQPDDPSSLEAQQTAAGVARRRDGASAHLLSGEGGVTSDPETEKLRLSSGSAPLGSSSSGLLR